MGYRHYIGYMPKSKLPEIMKKVEELKSKIGKPKEDDPEEKYDDWDITDYLQGQATLIMELGKLYCGNDGTRIQNVLEKNKAQDFSCIGTSEFYFVKNEVLLELSYAFMDNYSEWRKKAKKGLEEIRDSDKPLTDKQKAFINCLIFDDFESEIEYDLNNKQKPYDSDYYNYASCEFYMLHEYFDYKNNALCVWAW